MHTWYVSHICMLVMLVKTDCICRSLFLACICGWLIRLKCVPWLCVFQVLPLDNGYYIFHLDIAALCLRSCQQSLSLTVTCCQHYAWLCMIAYQIRATSCATVFTCHGSRQFTRVSLGFCHCAICRWQNRFRRSVRFFACCAA